MRDPALHEADLDAGIGVVEEPQIFLCAVGEAEFDLDVKARQGALIARAEDW
jgi:hypothetical protein